jgi:phosphoglycerate dehydrogenase-like enzyme
MSDDISDEAIDKLIHLQLIVEIEKLKEANASLRQQLGQKQTSSAGKTVSVLIVTEIGSELEDEMHALIAKSSTLAQSTIEFIRHPADDLHPGGKAHDVLTSAEVLLCSPGPVLPLLPHANALRWMQATWAGVNAIFDNTTKRDYVCTRLAGVFGEQMAEYILGYVLNVEKHMVLASQQQANKEWVKDAWHSEAQNRKLSQLTLGLMGLGSIGSEVAKAAKAMGMRVVGFKRDRSVSIPYVDELLDLPELLQTADYVANILPSTAHTRGLLDKVSCSCSTRNITRTQ